ncbi:MAG TPA: alpha/beta hydrolase, partial [Catenuloplanes sp.]
MSAATRLTTTGSGVPLEWLVTGGGDPGTVFAHGLAGDIAGTRPLGSAVAGRRVFFHFRGHGRSGRPDPPWGYRELADDLRAVADLTGATRALGVSLGAGALCRLLAAQPARFQRVVFFLPAALDTARPPAAARRLERLLAAVGAGDRAAVVDLLALDLPGPLRATPAAVDHLRRRADQLLETGLAPQLAGLGAAVPVPDRAALAAVTVPALVIGCVGDDLHPVPVAEQLAAALPTASLHVYDEPGVLWTARADLRERISAFLNAP